MSKTPKRPRDPNQLAKAIVAIATDEFVPMEDSKKVIRARNAGQVGGSARATALSELRRNEIAKTAAKARWQKEEKVPTDG
jgi:hypothetical protein